MCPWPRRGRPPWRNLAAHAGAAGFAGGGCQRWRAVPGAVGRAADPARCGWLLPGFRPPARKLWTASGSALNGRGKPCPRLILQGLEETAAYQDEAGKRYTGFMLQTIGLPLPGDYGQVPAKLWYLHKV